MHFGFTRFRTTKNGGKAAVETLRIKCRWNFVVRLLFAFSTVITKGSAFYKAMMLVLLTLSNLTVSFQEIY